MTGSGRTLRRIVPVRPGEGRIVLAAVGYFACLMGSYYMLRSIRDEIGSEHVKQLPDAWTFTFFVSLGMVPLYGWVAARWPRRVFVPLVGHVFAAQLVLLAVLLRMLRGDAHVFAEWTFYVWLSVFVVFVVAVFWGFMADVFRREQGQRLFGLIALGGSLGQLVGSAATSVLLSNHLLGRLDMLLLAAVLLEIGCFAAMRVDKLALAAGIGRGGASPVPSGPLRGIGLVLTDRYLLGIAAYLVLFTHGSAVIYFTKAGLAHVGFDDRAARAAFYARIEMIGAAAEMLGQAFVTGRLLPWLGMRRALLVMPILTAAGFVALGVIPTMATVVVFEVVRRATNFSFGKPAREVLFTVVSREERYTSKAFLDTAVYRGSDVGWAQAWQATVQRMQTPLTTVAWLSLPLAGLWAAVAAWLGRAQERKGDIVATCPTASNPPVSIAPDV